MILLIGGAVLTFIFKIEINNELILKAKRTLEYKHLPNRLNIDVYDISSLDRSSTMVFSSWGSSIVIIYQGKDLKENRVSLQESSYPVTSIKRLIKRLKEINPSIKLHPQYTKLINGEIEDERRFRRLPIR